MYKCYVQVKTNPMKHIFLFVLLLLTNFCLAHTPKVRVKKFGNVKTYYSSYFNFGQPISSEELKIQILGQLSQDLAEKLNYRDTIMVEYHVRLPEERKLFILENENSNYKLLGLVEGQIIESNKSGLAIRVIDERISVEEILKLVEYTIVNRKKINKYLQTVTFPYGYRGDNYVKVQANSEEFINTILKKKSKMVDEVMKKSIVFLDNGLLRTKLFWENNEFVFGINNTTTPAKEYTIPEYTQYKTSDFNYFADSPTSEFFVISEKESGLVYFDGKHENTSLISVPVYSYRMSPFYISKDRFWGKVIVSNDRVSFYVYNIHKKTTLKIE